jgi:hypothetical protein
MADMQQLENAFLKAHKAGDKKAAGVLAAEIKRQRASGSSAPADAPVSGMFDQFSAGMESNIELPGLTVETLGKTAQDKDLEASGKWLRDLTEQPKNFVSAADRFINPKPGDSYVDPIAGLGWGNAPGAAAEVGGQVAGDMMARGGASLAMGGLGAAGGFVAGGPVGAGAGFTGGAVGGALAGPALLEFMRVAGPVAIARAQNADPPREVPTWEDWQYAAGTAGLAGALNAIGIKGIGKLNAGVGSIAKKGVGTVAKEAVTDTAKKAGKEGITEFGQSVTEQTGSTLGTDKGLKIDLKQAVGEGILGAGAGGTIDAGRNISPTVRAINDIRSVDSSMRNNPDAQVQAETTLDVNNIADRMSGSGKAPVSQELNRYVSDIKKQINEAIDGQTLDPEDKKALKGGMQDATGLTQDRLDEIAGRSENPSEIKALARRIQVVREMTVQKQSNKGWRGWAALASTTLGGAAGGLIGSQFGPFGTAAGAGWGANIGRDIARKLRGSQTQGNAIDSLIGKKQARRAAMLLDRYGPSAATTALNTLTEKAAANSAQKEAEAQAQKDWDQTLTRIKMANTIRKNAREQWENAPPELKAQKKAEKEATDLKTREERLKGLAIRSEQSRVRLETMVNKLEAEKSTNALRIEKAQAERDLATAKAQNAEKGQILDLSGKLLKLVDDIKLREQAIKKSVAVTKRAEKMAERVPQAKQAAKAAATQTAKRYAKMTAEQMDQVEVDQFGNPIGNRAQYRMKAEDIMKLQADGLVDAVKFEDKAIGNIFIEAIGDFKNAPGHKNQAIRMAIYERVRQAVPLNNLDAQRFIALYIRPLAFAFEAASGDPNSFGSSSRRPEGREDFGTDEDTGEDPPF